MDGMRFIEIPAKILVMVPADKAEALMEPANMAHSAAHAVEELLSAVSPYVCVAADCNGATEITDTMPTIGSLGDVLEALIRTDTSV